MTYIENLSQLEKDRKLALDKAFQKNNVYYELLKNLVDNKIKGEMKNGNEF
jgi:hypothetical protein